MVDIKGTPEYHRNEFTDNQNEIQNQILTIILPLYDNRRRLEGSLMMTG
jgi:hypothetical protein